MCNNWLSKGRGEGLIRSICSLLAYRYSHHGQFQSTDMMSLHTELGRDANNRSHNTLVQNYSNPHTKNSIPLPILE